MGFLRRYLWKSWEAGKLKMLVQGKLFSIMLPFCLAFQTLDYDPFCSSPLIDMNVPIIDPDAKEDRKKILVDYFSTNRHNHEFYAFREEQFFIDYKVTNPPFQKQEKERILCFLSHINSFYLPSHFKAVPL
jgi:hypothetical protein